MIADSVGHHAHQRRPTRSARSATQFYPGLLGGAATLASVAGDAAANDVLPGRLSALGSRDDVVEIELGARRHAVTILAGIRIAGENVRAAEANVFARNPVVVAQHDDPGNRNLSGQYLDEIPASGHWTASQAPAIKVEHFVVFIDCVRAAPVDQREGSADRCHVNR